MSYPRNARRLDEIFRAPSFLKFDHSMKRQLLALITAAFILIQPTVLIAQRTRDADTKRTAASKTISAKPRKSSQTPSPAAALTSGNLVIYRVGTGASALASSATAVFLDEYTTSGGSAVQSIAMPTTDSGSNQTLTASGTATSEGLLTRSTDGNYLVLTGYDAAVGTASITSSTSATINRVIGRVTAAGTVDTTTALTDAISGGNPRSATSTNGTDLWISGTSSGGGIRYTTLGSTTSTSLTTTPTNMRQTNIFGGQLYISSQSGAFRLASVGTGTPTTAGQTTTNLPGYPTATTSPYGFFFADLDSGVAGVDTLYVADDNTASGTGGIQKYSLVSGTWTANGSIANTTGLRGLTGSVSGNNVTLFTTSQSSLLTVTDTTGYNATIAGTLSSIATAPTNTAFRGVAFAPGDAAPSVTGTTPANSATSVPLNSDISVTFSEAVNATSSSFTVSCGTSGAHTFALSGGPTTFTLNPDSDFANGEVCTVTVLAAQVTDQDTNDPPDNMTGNYVFSFTTVPLTPTLSINDVTMAEGDAGTTTFTFNVTLNAPALAGGVTFDIATADGTAQDDNPASEDNDYVAQSLTGQSIAAGSMGPYQFNVSVNGDTAVESNETFFVNVTNISGANAGDTQGQGTINNDDVALTPIHDIQGSGTSSPVVSTSVTTRGIVIGIKSGSSGGFFIQEPDATVDADPNTSEGVFVFTGSSVPAGAVVGNYVQVAGTVQEFTFASDPNSPPITEISGSPTVSVLSTGNSLPVPFTLTAAETTQASETTNPLDSLEEFEGMRVTVPSMTVVAPTDGSINEPNATVSGNDVFYGVVTGVARPFREAGVNISDSLPPGSPCCVPRFDENPERIRVDSDGQPGTTAVDVNAGAVLSNITGPLDYSFRTYTILPDITIVPGTQPGATAVPTPTANEVTVASFNMERFFDTTNDPSTSDPVLTTAAFNKRLDKASQIIRGVDRYPDVIGVEEMENLTTLQAVASKINADAQSIDLLPNPNYVAYLVEGNDVGGIDVGFLVKESRVTTVSVTQYNKTETYTNPNTGGLETLNDRPPLVLRATIPRPAGGTFAFTVIVNHLRSLSGIDDNTVSGSGTEGARVRAKRQAQAVSLANLIQSFQNADPLERIITVGDMNAFQLNDGYVDVIGTIKGTPAPDNETVVPGDGADLVNPDLTDLVDTLTANQQYSYSFDGNAQVLDHIIVNQPTLSFVNRFAYARDDADFAVKNYELTNNLRLSDHDQPVVYLSLGVPQPQGSVLISEFRFRGPGVGEPGPTGAPAKTSKFKQSGTGSTNLLVSTPQDQDEFVEIYNNTNSDVTVSTTDGSAGWALVAADGVTRFTIPNGTIIPARGHYLGVNSNGYSLAAYPAGNGTTANGDTTYTLNILDGSGIALFRTSNPANFTMSERLDAAGYTSVAALYREGAGFPTGGNETTSDLEYSFVRMMTRATNGLPKDTGDNAADFIGINTAGMSTGQGQYLGAPGPENLSSPINRDSQFGVALLDPSVSASSPPNRVRDFTSDPVNNSLLGTLSIRRTFTNNTGQPVTRLRFRIVEITTLTTPTPGQADLRARSSGDTTAMVNGNPVPVIVRGTTVEEPPTQPIGGGWNTSLNVPAVTEGVIFLDAPLESGKGVILLNTPLNSGESINVQFLLGVMQPGHFLFFVVIEAANGCGIQVADQPCGVFAKPLISK